MLLWRPLKSSSQGEHVPPPPPASTPLVASFHHSIVALSSMLGLPIIYLFPGACWLYPHGLGILETELFNASLAVWIVSHSIYSFKVCLAKLSFQSAKLARGKKCHSQRHLNLWRDPNVKCNSSMSTDVASTSNLNIVHC